MAKIKVTKIEAARRQIDTAIRMLFGAEDPIAVLTLISAAERILRDIGAQKNAPIHQLHLEMLKPGTEKEFWSMVNRPANFLKHADKDPDDILDNIDEKLNDIKIFISCLYYTDLQFTRSIEMDTFLTWFFVVNPHFINEEHAEAKEGYMEFADIRNESREAQLSAGFQLLNHTHDGAKPQQM